MFELSRGTRCLAILSGGIDSAVAAAQVRASGGVLVSGLHFKYGSKHEVPEGLACERLAAHLGVSLRVIDLRWMSEAFRSNLLQSGPDVPDGHYEAASMRQTVVPFRNGIFLAIAAGLAESQDCSAVVLGNHAGDRAVYPDCRAEFIAAFDAAMRIGLDYQVRVLSPLQNLKKQEIVTLGAQLRVPLDQTWSCYRGGMHHCGRCGTCSERREAFERAGIADPTSYVS